MTNINIQSLISACDTVCRRCTMIGGTRHGSAWLFDKLMRTFESHSAIEGVTIDVFINAPVMKRGTVTINRDGTFSMCTA